MLILGGRNKMIKISEQDLRNIGLSKYYVTSLIARIKEYRKNEKKDRKTQV